VVHEGLFDVERRKTKLLIYHKTEIAYTAIDYSITYKVSFTVVVVAATTAAAAVYSC